MQLRNLSNSSLLRLPLIALGAKIGQLLAHKVVKIVAENFFPNLKTLAEILRLRMEIGRPLTLLRNNRQTSRKPNSRQTAAKQPLSKQPGATSVFDFELN